MKKKVIRCLTAAIAVIVAAALLSACAIIDWGEITKRLEGDDTTVSETAAPGSTVPAQRTSSNVDTDSLFKRGTKADEVYSTVDIYGKNVNSVVGIRSESKSKNIFGQTTVNASSGTGIILTEDGYILTNNHVIEDGTAFKVTLYDGSTYDAEIIGAEKTNDVAVIKVDATGLQPATFGDTAEMVVGEDVIVIGNPLGELTFSLSRGVVSALNRAINEDGTPIIVFQVDAAVNEGNSGGPAFDSRGHVIGMVTAKVKSTQVEGIGFCIPVNDALNIAAQLIKYGFVKGKGALGIAGAVAVRQSFFGSTRVSGAYVNYVIPGSAAEKAGFVKGMLITEVDSTEITTPEELAVVIRGKPAGTSVLVKGVLDNEIFALRVTLDEYTPDMVPSGWNTDEGTIM